MSANMSPSTHINQPTKGGPSLLEMKHGPGFEGVQLPFEGRLNCSGIRFVGKKLQELTTKWLEPEHGDVIL